MNSFRAVPKTEFDRVTPWLPEELPADWDAVPLKSFVTGAKNGLWGDAPDKSDETVFCARVADFDRIRAVLNLDGDPTVRAVPARKRAGRLLRPGDLLLEKSGGGEKQPVGFVVLVESLPGDTICSNFVARMPVAEGADPRFVRYLHQHYYSRRINTRSIKQSTGIQNLDAQSYLQEIAPRPPLAAQEAIATFLDRETARIDTLIEKKRRLLNLLEEKRTALITSAVTRGLDPEVPMNDSGVEWIGEIPEHWDMIELRRVLRLVTSGSRGWAEHYAEEGALFIRIGNLSQESPDLDLTDSQLVNVPPGSEAERSRVQAGDLLVSITALIGAVGVVPDGLNGYVNQHVALCRFKSTRVNPRWAAYFLLSRPGQATVRLPVYGGTKEGLALDDVRGLQMVLPPNAEQDRIVRYLDSRLAKLAAIDKAANRAIALLQEYRTSLISAAVTGGLEIPEKVPADRHLHRRPTAEAL